MKKALVTGDLGFIGKHLCRALSASGEYEVFGRDSRRHIDEDIRFCSLPEADVCFHLAAKINVLSRRTLEDADHNIMGTLRILEKYREKVVFATTYAVNNPVTSYAITKLACEHYCRLYGARMIRMPNPTGLGGHGVIEAFTKADALKIAGDGSQRRQFVPVKRAIDAFLVAANSPPGTLHILTGVELSVLEIAELFFPTKPIEFIPQDKNDLAKYSHVTP